MLGKIIDMNNTDAFINLQNGTTIDISLSKIPTNSKIGDTINVPINNFLSSSTSNKIMDYFM